MQTKSELEFRYKLPLQCTCTGGETDEDGRSWAAI
jgi:hypothetical protein